MTEQDKERLFQERLAGINRQKKTEFSYRQPVTEQQAIEISLKISLLAKCQRVAYEMHIDNGFSDPQAMYLVTQLNIDNITNSL